jgi:PRA1 family protein 1
MINAPGSYNSSTEQAAGMNSTGANSQINRFISIPLDKYRALRPWGEFFSRSNFSRPPHAPPTLSRRFTGNLTYFESNYYGLIAGIFLVSLFTNLPLLLVTIIIAGLFMTINANVVGGDQVRVFSSDIPLNYALIAWGAVSLILMGIVGAFGTFFWVLGLSGFFIAIHASLYDSEPNTTMSTLQSLEEANQ